MAANQLLAGALEAGLEAASSLTSLAIAEAWQCDADGHWHLSGFYTPRPLVACNTLPDGRVARHAVDVQLAQMFAKEHSWSLSLAEKVGSTGLVEWAYEMSGDELLRRLNFDVKSALGIPIATSDKANTKGARCRAVFIIYSTEREVVSTDDSIRCGLHKHGSNAYTLLPKHCGVLCARASGFLACQCWPANADWRGDATSTRRLNTAHDSLLRLHFRFHPCSNPEAC